MPPLSLLRIADSLLERELPFRSRRARGVRGVSDRSHRASRIRQRTQRRNALDRPDCARRADCLPTRIALTLKS